MVFLREKTPPQPRVMEFQSGGALAIRKFSIKSKRFELQTRHANTQILHRRDEPLKYLALKTNQEYIQENYRPVAKEKPTLKGLAHRLTRPGNECKSSRQKSSQIIRKGDPFTNLECLPDRQEAAGPLPKHQDSGVSHFCGLIQQC